MIKSIPAKTKRVACTRPVLSPREEALAACRRIHVEARRPIYVCMSGGLKAETAAEAFRLARVPFRAAILRFKSDLNIHDIVRAVIYCEARGVPYEFFELDVKRFMNTKFAKLKEDHDFSIEDGPATTELIRKIWRQGGFPVLGGGFPEFPREGSGSKWRTDRSSARFQKWARKTGIRCEYAFFDSDPHLFQSILLNAQGLSGKMATQGPSLKNQIIAENFNLASRKTYHGYEKYLAGRLT